MWMNEAMAMTKRVLFVCLGNICRSPAAEAVLRRWAAKHSPEVELDVSSVGTIDIHVGERPDPRMRSAGEARGYRFTSRARCVCPEDLHPERYDLVIAMDRENLAALRQLAPASAGNIFLLSEFLDDNWPDEVPDPYYGGSHGFERVLDIIEASCPAIMKKLIST
jgi:protein-tyrosine phosphatase